MQYPTQYPSVTPIVELSSPTLPPPLLRNKEKECMDLAKSHLNSPQVQIIYDNIYKFIQSNLFVPCWKEVKQINAICEGKGKIGANEIEGTIQLRLHCGNYRHSINVTIPPSYPEAGVSFHFIQSNFSNEIQHIFQYQAEEICRRCVSGFSPQQALFGSKLDMPTSSSRPNSKSSFVPSVQLTNSGIKNLKHDVTVLKQISDLRVASTAKNNSKVSYSNTAVKRDARKDLRKLAKSEAENDEEQVKELKEQQQKEMESLMGTKANDVAQPSLIPVVRFLVEDFVCRMPLELCQACQKPVLPEDPNELNSTTASALAKKPMRTFCGHWLHFSCLDEWLTTPPFIRQCPVCTKRIWHPDWTADVKTLEHAWMAKEARQREVSDVSDFLGL